TGKAATLGRFVSGYPGLKLSATSLTITPKTWRNGQKCGDKPSFIQAKVNGRTVNGDPGKMTIPRTGRITVAFLPKSEPVGPPPNSKEKVAPANGGQTPGHGTTPTLPIEATLPPTPTSAPPASGTPPSTP